MLEEKGYLCVSRQGKVACQRKQEICLSAERTVCQSKRDTCLSEEKEHVHVRGIGRSACDQKRETRLPAEKGGLCVSGKG